MKRDIRYLTYSEVQDIFEDVYATGWPGPKISSNEEKFALLIQKASMKINGLTIPVFEEDE